MLYSYVLYWKMMFLKSNLMFCIEKGGMRISKNTLRKNLHSYVLYWKMRVLKSILLFYIEKWEFLRTLFRKMLYSYVLHWKMMFWSKILCLFVLKNEEWGFLKTLSAKNFAFLCIILKNDVFEVNSFVLYWKMRISKNSFVKKFYSYVLYWKMMFSKSIFLFCIEKWGMRISLKLLPKKCHILMYYIEKWGFWSQFFCFILKNDNF